MSGSGSELSYARVTGFSNAEFLRGLLDKSRKCAGGKTNENFCAGNAFPAQTKLYSVVPNK